MRILVRRAEAGDAEALAEVQFLAWSQVYGDTFPREVFGSWDGRQKVVEWKDLIARHEGLLVALWDDVPVAYGSCVPDGNGIKIMSLYVHPRAQGQRLGAELVRAMLDEFRPESVTVDCLEGNTLAESVYRHWRGSPQAGPPFDIGGASFRTTTFVWSDVSVLRRALTVVEIRPLADFDSREYLTELLHAGYRRNAEAGLHFIATWQPVEITRERLAKGHCFVAVAGETLVGTILVEWADNSYGEVVLDVPSSKISQFAVHPEWRGRRIGERLLVAAEGHAHQEGAHQLVLDTAAPASQLIAYYQRLGFRIIGEADWRPEVDYTSVVMAKPLEPYTMG